MKRIFLIAVLLVCFLIPLVANATDWNWKDPGTEKLITLRTISSGGSGLLVSTGLYYGFNRGIGFSNKLSAVLSYTGTVVGGYFFEDQVLRHNDAAAGASIVDMVFIGIGAGVGEVFLCYPKTNGKVALYPTGNGLMVSVKF